jgi:hypothetical protein
MTLRYPHHHAAAAGPPLIITALLDARATAWFDAQRRRWFPPSRLVVGAHVTLFHRLPARRLDAVRRALDEEAARSAPVPATVHGPRSLGGGVAYDLDCPPLLGTRRRLAARWPDDLTAQDRAWRRPHVTVQNKVTADVAGATLEALATASPPPVTVVGLALWRYLGGPWEPVARVPFAGTT